MELKVVDAANYKYFDLEVSSGRKFVQLRSGASIYPIEPSSIKDGNRVFVKSDGRVTVRFKWYARYICMRNYDPEKIEIFVSDGGSKAGRVWTSKTIKDIIKELDQTP